MSITRPDGLQVLTTVSEVRAYRDQLRAAGHTLGLVPTMGFLHEGHLNLMRAAQDHADVVMASVFVNPTQFAPDEDFETYPRDTEGDLAKARAAGCAAVFLPQVSAMYGDGAQTTVHMGPLAEELCGRRRPTHFTGVCTVVLKLFNITGCDVAVFGQKDYQQLAIIRQMVRDLDVPVAVVGHPIVRESDGLAKSSRNAYLDPDARRQAVALSSALALVTDAWGHGERDPERLEAMARTRIAEASLAVVDYVQVSDAVTLAPHSDRCDGDTVIALAVYFGATRLIDNVVLRG